MSFKKVVLYILPVFLVYLNFPINYQLNNACRTYESYYNLFFSSNCFYNPDNNAHPLEIMKRHTGLGESHQVTTEDGYILTLFRLPREKPRGVILIQHGVSHDSRFFLAQHNQSIAFFFWNAGYDVWLTNSRGTSYSQKHINLTTEDKEFWDFSFHEIGYYELNATIQYIKDTTKREKIVYVGLSMGGSAAVVYASLRSKECTNSVEVIVNLVPFIFTSTTSPVKHLFLGFSQFLLDYKLNSFFNWHHLLEHEAWYLVLFRHFNSFFPFKKVFVYPMLYSFGWTPDEFDPMLFNLMVDQMGSATSLKMFAHLYQLSLSKRKFHVFDYGLEGNMERYGVEEPFLYPLEEIQTPVLTVYGANDALVAPEDVEVMHDMLPENAKIYGKMKVEGLGHHDFVFGIHRNERVYGKILNLLNSL